MEAKFKVMTTSTGHDLKVYAVPQTFVWNARPGGKPKPLVPEVMMKTKAGPQPRLAKKGDPEWDSYQAALGDWQDAQATLQEDLQIVMALRDFQWPESPISPPDYLKLAVDSGVFVWPANDDVIGQRAAWFKATIGISTADLNVLTDIVQKLSGMEDELVDATRELFRRKLRETLLGDEEEAGGADEPDLETSEVSTESSLPSRVGTG